MHFYKSSSESSSDIFTPKALQIFEKILIEKFCLPFRILRMLFSSISQADANSKLLLNLDLALSFINVPSFANSSSDINQNSINRTVINRLICRFDKKSLYLLKFYKLFNLKNNQMKKSILLLAMGFALITQTLFAQIPSYVSVNGLVGYWPFNGNANDESGNGNNGTVNGATLTLDRFGNSNSGYGLSTLSDNLSVTNIQPSFNNNALTVSLWLKFPTQYNQSSLALVKNGIPYTNGFDVAIDQNDSAYGANNYLVVFLVGNGNAVSFISNQSELGVWSNIVSTFDGINIKIYLNGILKATQSFNQSMNIPNNNLVFGSWDNPTTPVIQTRQLDDIGIWNRALTQQEITNLYNSVSSNECLTMTINTGVLSTTPVTYTSSVNIYPNPANDQITIDCGNLVNVSGWKIKITNALGQEVFNQPMNTQQYVVPLNTWSGQGMYFVKIINAQNEVLNIKKIILQ